MLTLTTVLKPEAKLSDPDSPYLLRKVQMTHLHNKAVEIPSYAEISY